MTIVVAIIRVECACRVRVRFVLIVKKSHVGALRLRLQADIRLVIVVLHLCPFLRYVR